MELCVFVGSAIGSSAACFVCTVPKGSQLLPESLFSAFLLGVLCS